MESFICKTCGTHTPIIDRKAPGLCVMCQTTDPNNAGDAP